MIPKIIHQTWKNTDIPEKWKKSSDDWQRLHPDWKYILWTDADIRNHIKNNHPEFLELHDHYEYPIQRADMIRYFVLYDFGGVYCDLDLYPTENIEKYITCNTDHFVYSANSDCFTNAFMISPPGSLNMKKMIENLKNDIPWWAFGKHLKVMTSTGPLFLTKLLYDSKDTFCVLPKYMFNPYSVTEDFTQKKEGAVIGTLEGSSWHSWDSSFYNFLLKYRTFFIVFGVLSILSIIIGLIYYIIKFKRCRESKNKCEQTCNL